MGRSCRKSSCFPPRRLVSSSLTHGTNYRKTCQHRKFSFQLQRDCIVLQHDLRKASTHPVAHWVVKGLHAYQQILLFFKVFFKFRVAHVHNLLPVCCCAIMPTMVRARQWCELSPATLKELSAVALNACKADHAVMSQICCSFSLKASERYMPEQIHASWQQWLMPTTQQPHQASLDASM